MLLKSLEIFGFKTFPDKTVLKFNKGISVVVGPNGSGKSNVSDAIRWVLGEQSLRLLRCSKMEDVVFNGTVDRKSKGYAEVSLVVDNKDRKLNIEEDNVIITRRYYRSTESEYLLNNKQVRLKDINELFMDTGLGRDGYSIIGQGKIDEIVSSKSEDRREIFDEAAGISKFRYRKTEAEKKLEKTEENLVRINDILTELEGRVGPLFKEAEKAKEYVNLAKEQKDVQIGLWLNDLDKSSLNLKEINKKLNEASSQYSEIEKSLEDIIKKTEDSLKEINILNIEIDKETRENSQSEEIKAGKVNKISVLENDLVHNEGSIKRIILEVEGTKKSFTGIKEKKEELEKIIESLKLEKSKKEEELLKYKNENADVNNRFSNISVEITDLNKTILEINSKDSLNKANEIATKTAIEETKEKIIKNEENVKNKEEDLKILKENFKEVENQCKEAEKSIVFKIEQMNKTKKDISLKQKKLEEMKENISKLKLDYDSIKRKIDFLKNLEENLEGFSFSVKFIMKESKLKNLSGILGPVISLLKVDSKYSLAIETALGAASQHIVTEEELDAKNAINLLKEKKAGRATFLPISNISGRRLEEHGLSRFNGFIGIASDLVEFEAKFRDIFYSLMGRIVICDNLNNASVIARNFSYRFKIVTLDGQVINAGGSLTGGSANKNLGVLQRNKEISNLEDERKKISKDLEVKKEDLKKAILECENLKNALKNTEENLALENKENIKIKTDYNSVSFKVNEWEKSLENFKKEKEELLSKLEKLNKKKEEATKGTEKNSTDLKKLEENLKSLEIEKGNIEKKKDEVAQNVSKFNLELLSVAKDIELNENSLKVLIDNETSGTEKVRNLLEEKEFLEKKDEEIKKEMLSLKEEIEKSAQNSSNSQAKIKELTEKRIGIEKNITEFRNKEREITGNKENMSLECARFKDKIDSLQKNYDEIIAKMWDEYEITKTEAMSNFKKLEETDKYNKILTSIKMKIKSLGSVNVAAIEEYKEVNERYTFLKHQVEDVEKSKKELHKLINDLVSQMKELFSTKFSKINENFSKVFKELFGGGKAELTLINSDDVLNTGINIYVQPPGKIVSHIESLSGGEKALVAISLYFAIMLVNPVPFCVLDEIEAALDDVNVSRFAFYLRKMSENTQFIAITHRRGTMEQADMMYGVTMQHKGISKLLELNLENSSINFGT